jgi:catechol 2,3-dioxygenase-like lactoylglutathione lyase family enzyme
MADQGAVAARLDHVGLAVADLETAVAWFCDVFGLVPELTLRVDAIDLSIEMLIHPAYGYRLEPLHRPTGAQSQTLAPQAAHTPVS